MERGRNNKIAQSYKKRYTPLNLNREGYENMPDGRSKSSPFQKSTYRAPQRDEGLIAGHGATFKGTGGSVFSQIVHKQSDKFAETKDMVKQAVIGAVVKGATGGVA